jgi:hypothetical protein
MDYREKKIEERIKLKDARLNKTELSIGFRWAVNCAINFVPKDLLGTKEGFKEVKEWYKRFMELDADFMEKHLPYREVTYEPITPATPEEAEAVQRKIEAVQAELINNEDKAKREEAENQ